MGHRQVKPIIRSTATDDDDNGNATNAQDEPRDASRSQEPTSSTRKGKKKESLNEVVCVVLHYSNETGLLDGLQAGLPVRLACRPPALLQVAARPSGL